ncbi:MAG: hypothetical protein HYV35_08800 [Lentisphaerae bacterium]|nr:hypothetical protein [Lentisphaerota bacterium]
MKTNKAIDKIEREVWLSGRSVEPFVGSSGWQEGVMAEIRAFGPLSREMPRRAYQSAPVLAWAAAVAACLVIGLVSYTVNNLNADAVIAGSFLADPTDLTMTANLFAVDL